MKLLVCTQFCWYLFSNCSHFIVCTLIVLALFSFHSHLYSNNKGNIKFSICSHYVCTSHALSYTSQKSFSFVVIIVLVLFFTCTRLYQLKEPSLTLFVLWLYSTCTRHSLMVNKAFLTLLCTLIILHMYSSFFDGQQSLHYTTMYSTCTLHVLVVL